MVIIILLNIVKNNTIITIHLYLFIYVYYINYING